MGSVDLKSDADRNAVSENAEDHDEIVIVHSEMGVYLGCALGLGFWSNLDAADQTVSYPTLSLDPLGMRGRSL